MSDYYPKPENKFTFGLWTVGNIGRDPFGAPVREQKTPAELVYLLGEVGAYGVNFHDMDWIQSVGHSEVGGRTCRGFRKDGSIAAILVRLGRPTSSIDRVFMQ